MPSKNALKAVREQRGLKIADVATYAKIPRDRLATFEDGSVEPTRKQMDRLADAYGVPLYAFFSEQIPDLSPPLTDFRKAEPSEASVSARGFRTILNVEQTSSFAWRLAHELEFRKRDFTKAARLGNSLLEMGARYRDAFDNWFGERERSLQLTGSETQKFTSALRLFIEIQGTSVSINDAPAEDFLGFYIKNDRSLPSIFANRKISSKKAQLFTIAHEYAHAIINSEGISNPFDSNNEVERSCNSFAAEFIAPLDKFSRTIEALPASARRDPATFIAEASKNSLLSKHAAAIRLMEGDYLKRRDYQSWRRLFVAKPLAEKEEEKEETAKPMIGAPHAKRLSEIGYLPTYLAGEAVSAKLIDRYDVSDGLGLSVKLQDKAFALAARRVEAAMR